MIDGTDLRFLAPVRTGMIYIQTMKSVRTRMTEDWPVIDYSSRLKSDKRNTKP